MKYLILIAVTIFTSGVFAAFGEEVELVSRYHQDGNYITATYSFFHETRDDEDITSNNWELIFETQNDFKDYFGAVMAVDQVGRIIDLGEKSCSKMVNEYEQGGPYSGSGQGGYPHKEDRVHDPMFWLMYSAAFDRLSFASTSAIVEVKEGHCYLLDRVNSEQRVIVAFHVKEHTENTSVKIDEIEVFGKFNIHKVK